MLKLIGIISVIIAAVLSVAPEPITPNVVRLTWQTQPETTYINVRDTTFNSVGLAQSATGGVTNTVTISGTENMVFQIQEYKLVNSRLEMITFFNTEPVPHVDFPTATQTSQPSVTPVPTNTPISNMFEGRLYIPIIMC